VPIKPYSGGKSYVLPSTSWCGWSSPIKNYPRAAVVLARFRGTEEPYAFHTIEKLLDDFERDCTCVLEDEETDEVS